MNIKRFNRDKWQYSVEDFSYYTHFSFNLNNTLTSFKM